MTNKSKKIQSEISAGELLDKISILEIKLDKIKNPSNHEQIKKEYDLLKEVQNSNIEINNEIKKLCADLKAVNLTLWDVEDKIRICEKNKDFTSEFIELARAVYSNNDKRAKIKSDLNEMLGSNIREIKQYVNY